MNTKLKAFVIIAAVALTATVAGCVPDGNNKPDAPMGGER